MKKSLAVRLEDSILARTVYPRFYRPKKVSDSLKANAELRNIYPEDLSTLSLESQLYAYKPSFLPDLKVVTPAVDIAKVPAGRIITDNFTGLGVIDGHGCLQSRFSIQFNNGFSTQNDNIAFKAKRIRRPLKVMGNVFCMLTGAGGNANYFHWMFDVLPKMHLLKKSGWYNEIDYFYIPHYDHRLFQLESFQKLAIDRSQVISSHEYPHIKCDNLLVTTPTRYLPHIPTWICAYLRELYPEGKDKAARRIYISRKDAGMRNIQNETEIIDLLRKYNFESIYLEGKSIRAQADIFSSAEIIISSHGAGLSNLVFASPGAKVIELFDINYVMPFYFHLAQKKQLQYDFILSGTKSKSDIFQDLQRQNIKVNLQELEKKLLNTI